MNEDERASRNPHRGDTDITVGDETFTLCYDLNACAKVMKSMDVHSFDELAQIDLGQKDLGTIIYIMWAGFNRYHPDMTVEDVGALEWDLYEALPAIGEAFSRGLTRQVDSDQDKGGSPTGKGSRKRGTGRKRNA